MDGKITCQSHTERDAESVDTETVITSLGLATDGYTFYIYPNTMESLYVSSRLNPLCFNM